MSERYPFPADPHGMPSAAYRRRHEEAPLDSVVLASDHTAVMAVRHADVKEVMANPAFSRRILGPGSPRVVEGEDLASLDPEAPNLLINMDPPRHTRLRRLVSAAFHPRRIDSWRPRIEKIADQLLDRMAPGGDLVTAYALPLPIAVISEILGVPLDDREKFRGWSEIALSAADLGTDERIERAFQFFGHLQELIAEHRADPGDGLVDALIADGSMTESEALRMLGLLVVGGYETTSTVLARGLYTLLAEPKRYRALSTEPGLIPTAVEEILRCHPASDAALLRVATQDVALPSGPVRSGQFVLPVTAAANLDPTIFEDPEAFDLHRTEPAPHLSFGHGPHYCLGAGLARLELNIAVERLILRFPELGLAAPANEITWLDTALVRRPESLPVTWNDN